MIQLPQWRARNVLSDSRCARFRRYNSEKFVCRCSILLNSGGNLVQPQRVEIGKRGSCDATPPASVCRLPECRRQSSSLPIPLAHGCCTRVIAGKQKRITPLPTNNCSGSRERQPRFASRIATGNNRPHSSPASGFQRGCSRCFSAGFTVGNIAISDVRDGVLTTFPSSTICTLYLCHW